jgi:hypothetical protein
VSEKEAIGNAITLAIGAAVVKVSSHFNRQERRHILLCFLRLPLSAIAQEIDLLTEGESFRSSSVF